MTELEEMSYGRLRKIFVWRMGVAPRAIYPDAALGADLGLDGVDLADLADALAEEFGISVAEAAEFLSPETAVEDIAKFLAGTTRG